MNRWRWKISECKNISHQLNFFRVPFEEISLPKPPLGSTCGDVNWCTIMLHPESCISYCKADSRSWTMTIDRSFDYESCKQQSTRIRRPLGALRPRGRRVGRLCMAEIRKWGTKARIKPCEAQANRGRSCHSLAVHCTVNFFFIWVPLRMRCRGSGASVSQRFEGRVCLSTRCRGCGKSVCIGFERWMKHTSRGSGPSVFNGFEGRVRHTLASHSGPFWATSWTWILLGFAVSHASRCRGCGNSVCIGFERWMKHTSRGSGASVFNGFEGRVRHSHSGPFWATSWAWILLGFRSFACIVHSMFSGPWSSSQPRPKLPFTCRPLHG